MPIKAQMTILARRRHNNNRGCTFSHDEHIRLYHTPILQVKRVRERVGPMHVCNIDGNRGCVQLNNEDTNMDVIGWKAPNK